MFKITTESIFPASHALQLPDGSMEPTHGHNWPVWVTVASGQLDAMDCVMDFHELERLVEQTIAPFRNRHLNDVPPFVNGTNPSAERVAEHIAQAVTAGLPAHVALIEVRVGEAPGCTAAYQPD